MTRTVRHDSGPVEVLKANAALRSWASALRELSVATRQGSLDARTRNHALRERAASLTAACSWIRDHSACLGPTDLDPVPGMIKLDELVEILTEYHGMAAHDAIIGIAVEMERAGFPRRVEAVDGGDALELVRHVVDGRPRRGP